MKVVWSLWARSLATAAAWCFFFGGAALFFAYKEQWPQLVIYCYCCVVILALLFSDSWPFHHIGAMRIVVQQYWVNAVLLLGMAVYPCFALPTVFSGIALALSAIMFGVAAATGEKGKTLAQLRGTGSPSQ